MYLFSFDGVLLTSCSFRYVWEALATWENITKTQRRRRKSWTAMDSSIPVTLANGSRSVESSYESSSLWLSDAVIHRQIYFNQLVPLLLDFSLGRSQCLGFWIEYLMSTFLIEWISYTNLRLSFFQRDFAMKLSVEGCYSKGQEFPCVETCNCLSFMEKQYFYHVMWKFASAVEAVF